MQLVKIVILPRWNLFRPVTAGGPEACLNKDGNGFNFAPYKLEMSRG